MNEQAQAQREDENKRELQIIERNLEYHAALQKQLEELEARKQQELQDFLKEKAAVDEIVRKIAMEDERFNLASFETVTDVPIGIIKLNFKSKWKQRNSLNPS